MSGKPKTTFSLQNGEEYEKMLDFARAKGFTSIGSFARFAAYQYMSRYPLKKDRGGTASGDSEHNFEGE